MFSMRKVKASHKKLKKFKNAECVRHFIVQYIVLSIAVDITVLSNKNCGLMKSVQQNFNKAAETI